MDAEKFDDLIKRVGTARVNRLTALRGLLGGAAVALTGTAVASGDAEAKKKKAKNAGNKRKKGRKRNSQSYNGTPAPTTTKTTTTTTTKPTTTSTTTKPPTCDKHEDCGHGAEWDDQKCECRCKEEHHEICRLKDPYDDPYYLNGTCVDTKCPDIYDTYNSETCKCERPVCEAVYDCGDYEEWNEKECRCECAPSYEICEHGPYAGQCVDTTCKNEYLKFDKSECACVCKREPEYCDYGFEWSPYDCRCVKVKNAD
jgi:hypothetical protein